MYVYVYKVLRILICVKQKKIIIFMLFLLSGINNAGDCYRTVNDKIYDTITVLFHCTLNQDKTQKNESHFNIFLHSFLFYIFVT